MSRWTARHLLGPPLALLLLTGCTLTTAGSGDLGSGNTGPAAQQTARATGVARPEGGIGGTGAPLIADGTPATGLFGTVAGFGSILVNGRTIELAPAQAAATAELGVGSTVLIEALAQDGMLIARKVEPFIPLAGPITAFGADGRSLRVMGIRVELADDATIDTTTLEMGQAVALAGLWQSRGLLATRLQPMREGEAAAIRGLLLPDADGLQIADLVIDAACCVLGETPTYAEIKGGFAHGRLIATKIATGASLLFADDVAHLSIEGFLAPNPNDPGVHLSGFGIPIDASSPATIAIGQRGIFRGAFDDAFHIESSQPLP